METKTCTKCGEDKPATTEYFYKSAACLHGVRPECKSCALIYKKEREQLPEIKEQRAAYRKEYSQDPENKARKSTRMKVYLKQYLQELPSAVYEIYNKENGYSYVGASTMFPKRWNGHKSNLRKGSHMNLNIQEDYNKYGLDAFEFKIIEEFPCDTQLEILERREQEEIKKRLSEGQNLYNAKVRDKRINDGKLTKKTRKKTTEKR